MLAHCIELSCIFFKGVCISTGLIIFQLLCFLTCFILSILLAFGLSVGIHSTFNSQFPPYFIAFLQGLFLIGSAKLQDSIFRRKIRRGIKKFPISMGLIPVLFTMTLSLYGMYEIFTQFFQFHYQWNNQTEEIKLSLPSSPPAPPVVSLSLHPHEKLLISQTLILLISSNGLHVCRFILAFSFLVYNTTQKIQTEVQQQLRFVNGQVQQVPKFVVSFFFLCQLGLTFGYSIPIYYSLIILNDLVTSKGIVVYNICILATVLSFLGSYMESKNPFPQVKGLAPYFPFENNIIGSLLILKYVLLPFVYLYFFQHIPLPSSETISVSTVSNIKDHDFILFTLFFSLLILHTVKILSLSIYIPRITIHRQLRRLRRRRHGQNFQDPNLNVNGEFQELGIVEIDVQNFIQVEPNEQIEEEDPDPTPFQNGFGLRPIDSTNNNDEIQILTIVNNSTETESFQPNKREENDDDVLMLNDTKTCMDLHKTLSNLEEGLTTEEVRSILDISIIPLPSNNNNTN